MIDDECYTFFLHKSYQVATQDSGLHLSLFTTLYQISTNESGSCPKLMVLTNPQRQYDPVDVAKTNFEMWGYVGDNLKTDT